MSRQVRLGGLGCVAALAAAGLAVDAFALPPVNLTKLYRSGEVISGVGNINSPFFSGGNGGEGFRGVCINNSAGSFVHVGVYVNPGFNQALLDSAGGLGSPFLAAGLEAPDPGSITVPSTDYVLDAIFSTSINDSGNGAFALQLRSAEGAGQPTITGIYFNKSAMPIRHGDPVTAAGVAPGATWAVFDTASVVQINDSNTLLIGSRIFESGQFRRALIKVQLDPLGTLVSQTLVAKEGGPVGAGPDTWATIAIGPHSIAMNNSGAVIFSGTTAGGNSGIFLNGAFVARDGQPGPLPSSLWTGLPGSPVDINASGSWAARATLSSTGVSTWNEVGDAGETYSGFFSFTANGVVAPGWVRQFNGSLSSDHDVDLYYIRIGDPTQAVQEPFSVTTVPDPGNGFAGAAFDTVLYLFRDFHNANGAFRTGLGRCDDAAPGVMQSTLGPASLPTDHAPGTGYFLGISTPKARAIAGFTTQSQMWQDDPGTVAVAGGTLYWPDPSEGRIGRIDTATGAALSPLTVSVIPAQTQGQIAEDAPVLSSMMAVHDTGGGGPGSKLYFIERRFFPWRLNRCNLDGTGIETIRTSSDAGPSIAGINALSIDSTNGKIYWSRPLINGEINRCNLDGSSPETVVTLDTTRVGAMAVDPVSGKIYYHEPVANSLNRCNLDGTVQQIVSFPILVRGMTADVAGRRLYISLTNGTIRRLNLDTGTFTTDFLTTNATPSLAADTAGGRLYWTNGAFRAIRRADLSSALAEDWTSVGPDIGERPSEGPGYLDSFNSFQKNGAMVPDSLPYQIRLTGVTAAYPLTVIVRNGAKVVSTGDALPSTGGDGVTTIGALASPVKIADSGLIAWRGRWISTVAPTGLRTAVFLDREEVYRDTTAVAGAIGGIAASTSGGAYGFDLSATGQHLIAETSNGSFSGAGDNCILVRFATPPTAPCRADINGSGSVTVQDIFDYLALYFIGCA